MGKIRKGEPVPKPDYEIKSYRVKYICIDCPTMFDNFTSIFDVTVNEQNAIITSADYFRETLDDLLNDDEADKDFVDIVKRILKDIERFDGDIWVYSRN
jgi:hypothetical protein